MKSVKTVLILLSGFLASCGIGNIFSDDFDEEFGPITRFTFNQSGIAQFEFKQRLILNEDSVSNELFVLNTSGEEILSMIYEVTVKDTAESLVNIAFIYRDTVNRLPVGLRDSVIFQNNYRGPYTQDNVSVEVLSLQLFDSTTIVNNSTIALPGVMDVEIEQLIIINSLQDTTDVITSYAVTNITSNPALDVSFLVRIYDDPIFTQDNLVLSFPAAMDDLIPFQKSEPIQIDQGFTSVSEQLIEVDLITNSNSAVTNPFSGIYEGVFEVIDSTGTRFSGLADGFVDFQGISELNVRNFAEFTQVRGSFSLDGQYQGFILQGLDSISDFSGDDLGIVAGGVLSGSIIFEASNQMDSIRLTLNRREL